MTVHGTLHAQNFSSDVLQSNSWAKPTLGYNSHRSTPLRLFPNPDPRHLPPT